MNLLSGLAIPAAPRRRTAASLLLFAAMLITLAAGPALLAQTTDTSTMPSADELRREARSRGYNPSDLSQLGINLDNPEQAMKRARALGIPEGEIQQYLDQYRSNQQSDARAATAMDTTAVDSARKMSSATAVQKTLAHTDTLFARRPELTELKGRGRFEGLNYFGYRLFRDRDSDFSPIEVGPVDPGYVISSGDVLRLYLWGQVEFQYELPVDASGHVVIPNVGRVFVAGTRLEELRDKLKNFLAKYYSGLKASPPEVFLDVQLAEVRGTQIYLMGEVLRPGTHVVSAFATAFNLMYYTGGPKITGSLREIRVLREGKVVTQVDLYDYLQKGRSTSDVRLQNNDVVFVPPRGTTVAIEGPVKRPAIYEVSDGETLRDLVEIAGGLTPTAYVFRAQIDRIVPFQKRDRTQPDREVVDVDLAAVMAGRENVELVDGDRVTVYSYNDYAEDYVEIFGLGIARPGRYSLAKAPTVRDLVMRADSLMGNADMTKGDLIRTREDFTEVFYRFDLEKAMEDDPDHNLRLAPMDRVRIYAEDEMSETPWVTIEGHVQNPGTYVLPEEMTLHDLIFMHAGLQDSLWRSRTYMEQGEVRRLLGDGRTRETIRFSPRKVWNQEGKHDLVLQPSDIVRLHERSVTEMVELDVRLYGAVRNPDTYTWSRGMSLADLILLGGGVTEQAWLLEAEVSRTSLKGYAGNTISEVKRVPLVDWSRAEAPPEELIQDVYAPESPAAQFILQPDDRVKIQRNPDYRPPRVVWVSGEVIFPGAFVLERLDEKLSEIIDRAGGVSSIAHVSGARLIRDSTRVFIDFESLLREGDEREDLVVKDGDRIVIPEKPNAVTVMGAVTNAGIYKYIEGKRAKDYIDEAGGVTENAGRSIVIQPSGRTYEIGFLKNPKVKDGAVVRVLPKPPEEDKEPIDWSQIIQDGMALLASALTIIVLAQRAQ